jgi:O-antigen/teichoic acid export membrane protein
MTKRFRVHAGHYAWAELAAAAAGLISFPILTRLLSVADYGTMNLVASVLGLTIALGKLGLQHAVLRSWAEVAAGRRADVSREGFESTVVLGMAACGLAVTVVWMLAARLVPQAWWGAAGVGAVMLVAAPLILVRVLDSAGTNLLRAQEASAALAVYNTLRRYVALVAVVAVLWWWRRDLTGFYLTTLAVELLAVALLLVWMFLARPAPRPARVSGPLFVSLAIFGLPMLGSELATVVLTMSDRFIIQTHLGADALGVYAAAYNLCDQLRNALLGALVGAAYPRCMHLWETEGEAGLLRFTQRFLQIYATVSLGLVALMVAAGGDLMAVLASEKYREGGQVAGWIMASLSVQTVLTVAAVGLYLARRSALLMGLVLLAGILNIALNLWWVPRLGIQGAALAALVSFGLLGAAQMRLAQRTAATRVPWRGLITLAPAAALAVVLAWQWQTPWAWLTLLARGGSVVLVYGGLVVALDAQLRDSLVQYARRRWRAGR